MHVFCLKVKSLSIAMWIFPIYHYSPHCGKEFELSDESQKVDDEISALIIFHEPLLRHIIGLRVDDPVDREDVYQETVVAILEHLRKGRWNTRKRGWQGLRKTSVLIFIDGIKEIQTEILIYRLLSVMLRSVGVSVSLTTSIRWSLSRRFTM